MGREKGGIPASAGVAAPSSLCIPHTAECIWPLEEMTNIQPHRYHQDRRGTALLSRTLLLCSAAPLAEVGAWLPVWSTAWEDYPSQELHRDFHSRNYKLLLFIMSTLQEDSHGHPCGWSFLQYEKLIS